MSNRELLKQRKRRYVFLFWKNGNQWPAPRHIVDATLFPSSCAVVTQTAASVISPLSLSVWNHGLCLLPQHFMARTHCSTCVLHKSRPTHICCFWRSLTAPSSSTTSNLLQPCSNKMKSPWQHPPATAMKRRVYANLPTLRGQGRLGRCQQHVKEAAPGAPRPDHGSGMNCVPAKSNVEPQNVTIFKDKSLKRWLR